MKNGQAYKTWRIAYESILRKLLSANAAMNVYNMIFSLSSKWEPDRSTTRQVSSIQSLSKRYDTHFIDVASYLRSITTHEQFEALYSDPAHYSRPLSTALIRQFVANAIGGSIRTPRTGAISTGKQTTFDSASCMTFHAPTLDAHIEFKNGRYQREAVILHDSCEIRIPGSLLPLGYITSEGAGRLLVEEEGFPPFMIETMHKDIAKGMYSFLIRSFVLSWKTWGSPEDSAPRMLKLSLVRDLKTEEATPIIQQHNMCEPAEGQQKVFLTHTFCC